MQIYTGYFAKIKLYQEHGLYPISVALYNPRWMPNVMQYRTLAPTSSILDDYKKNHDVETYISRYYTTVLQGHLPGGIREVLAHFCPKEYRGVVLLCYERPEDFCHRHIIAKWLNSEGHEPEVKEFPIK